MSLTGTVHCSLSVRTLQPKNSHIQSIDFSNISRILSFPTSLKQFPTTKSVTFSDNINQPIERKKAGVSQRAGSVQELDDDAPLSVQLEPITSESQFDRIIAEAQQLEESLIIVWMASWCRKCIYLKPKLEKLAANYHPRLRFYYVDVNSVPHKVVARAEVTKMPTIQLWKDGKKQDEVIGGHKAYMAISEIRQMIENVNTI